MNRILKFFESAKALVKDILDAGAEPVQKMPDLTPAKMREVILKAKQKLGQLV